MAIRSRLISRPPVYEGVPHPEFAGYVWRFGYLCAEFTSPGMLKLIGRAPQVKNAPATIKWYTEETLRAYIRERVDAGFNCKHLNDVLFNWPSYEDAIELPSYVDPTLRFGFAPLTLADK